MLFPLQVAICQGNFEGRYINHGQDSKGNFTSQNGETVAFLDQSFYIVVDGKQYGATIRHVKCELLIDGNLCASCNGFHDIL